MCVPSGGVRKREPAGSVSRVETVSAETVSRTGQTPTVNDPLDYNEADDRMNTLEEEAMWEEAGVVEEYPFAEDKYFEKPDDRESQSEFSMQEKEWSGMSELSVLESLMAVGVTGQDGYSCTTTAEDWDRAVLFRDENSSESDKGAGDDEDSGDEFYETDGDTYTHEILGVSKNPYVVGEKGPVESPGFMPGVKGDARDKLKRVTYDPRTIEVHDTILLPYRNDETGIFKEKTETVDLGEVAILGYKSLFSKRRPHGMAASLLNEMATAPVGKQLHVQLIGEAYDNLYIEIAETVMDQCFKIIWPEDVLREKAKEKLQQREKQEKMERKKAEMEAKRKEEEKKKKLAKKKKKEREESAEKSAKNKEEEEEENDSKSKGESKGGDTKGGESKAESKKAGNMEPEEE